jgi:hypothetical protein
MNFELPPTSPSQRTNNIIVCSFLSFATIYYYKVKGTWRERERERRERGWRGFTQQPEVTDSTCIVLSPEDEATRLRMISPSL